MTNQVPLRPRIFTGPNNPSQQSPAGEMAAIIINGNPPTSRNNFGSPNLVELMPLAATALQPRNSARSPDTLRASGFNTTHHLNPYLIHFRSPGPLSRLDISINEPESGCFPASLFTDSLTNQIRVPTRQAPLALQSLISNSDSGICGRPLLSCDVKNIEQRNDCWIPLKIDENDGGEHSEMHGQNNLLVDNLAVYCTGKKNNANLSFCHVKNSYSQISVFTLCSIVIKIPPSAAHASPLKSGFVFVLSRKCALAAFSQFDEIDYKQVVDSVSAHGNSGRSVYALPSVPKCVLAVLYFHLDANNPIFAYQFKWPIKHATHVIFKFLDSHGLQDSTSVQFIGLRGVPETQCFPGAELN